MKQHRSATARVIAAAALLAATPGCSFLFVKTPPPADGRLVSSKDCTSSLVAPIIDSGVGAFQVGRTVLAATADDSVYDDPNAVLSREADIALGVGFTALFVSSAVYGYVHTGHCRELQHQDSEYELPPEPAEKWDASTPKPPPNRGYAAPAPQTSAPASSAADSTPSAPAPPASALTPAPELPADGPAANPPP